MSAGKQKCMVIRTIYSEIIRAMSSTLHTGGRSNGSLSPEADLNAVSLMLTLLALSTADSGCGCSEIDRLERC